MSGLKRKPWNPFTKWWLLWGAAFVAIETTAIVQRHQHSGGTLSSLVWRFTEHPVQKAYGPLHPPPDAGEVVPRPHRAR